MVTLVSAGLRPHPKIPCKGFLGRFCSGTYCTCTRVVPWIAHQRIASAQPQGKEILPIDGSISQKYSIFHFAPSTLSGLFLWPPRASRPTAHTVVVTCLWPPICHLCGICGLGLILLKLGNQHCRHFPPRKSSSSLFREEKTLLWSNPSHLEIDTWKRWDEQLLDNVYFSPLIGPVGKYLW